MQYSVAAVLALAAASASAHVANGTVVYTTEVFTAYTTYCPASTALTFNGVTYTVSEATTLTITNCPCTVSKPVTTSSVVYCATCAPTSAVIPPPVYTNGTVVATPTKGSVGTTSAASTATATPSTITASGAEKVMALSGASLAGLLGLAAYLL